MTPEQWIYRAMAALSVAAEYVPTHTVQGEELRRRIHALQCARIEDMPRGTASP